MPFCKDPYHYFQLSLNKLVALEFLTEGRMAVEITSLLGVKIFHQPFEQASVCALKCAAQFFAVFWLQRLMYVCKSQRFLTLVSSIFVE